MMDYVKLTSRLRTDEVNECSLTRAPYYPKYLTPEEFRKLGEIELAISIELKKGSDDQTNKS